VRERIADAELVLRVESQLLDIFTSAYIPSLGIF